MGYKVRDSSAGVYRVMFNRYLDFLASRGLIFVQATSETIGDFLKHDFSPEPGQEETTRETKLRYIRLIERAYSHATTRGAIALNPVSAYIAGGKNAVKGYDNVIPAEVDPDQVLRLTAWLGRKAVDLLARAEVHAEQKAEKTVDLVGLARRPSIHRGSKNVKALWRQGRDMAIAALSLGTGMRCTEIVSLVKSRVTYIPGNESKDRFVIEVPPSATVATAKGHRVLINSAAVHAVEAWWQFRFNAMVGMLDAGVEDVVFPAGPSGRPMKEGTLYANLKPLSEQAISQGVISKEYSWILENGATGLRRAYILASLVRGVPEELLTERLGHQDPRSIRRYAERSRKIRAIQAEVAKRME